MRRLSLAICTIVFISACGHKKVQVRAPQPAPVSARDLEGIASYYAEPYHGRKTASGEIFDTYQALTAAHRTLPFNTLVRVTNKRNGREVDVRINDRGPFIDGRVIDLSLRAAREIDLVGPGIVPVKLKILKAGEVARAPLLPAPAAPPLPAPAAVSAPPAPAPPAPPAPAFAVQVGAFGSAQAAEDLKRRLEERYSEVTVQMFTSDKTLYRVWIGREPDLQAAEKLASELRKEDFQPFVVRVN